MRPGRLVHGHEHVCGDTGVQVVRARLVVPPSTHPALTLSPPPAALSSDWLDTPRLTTTATQHCQCPHAPPRARWSTEIAGVRAILSEAFGEPSRI